MKRFFAIAICTVLLFCMIPVSVFAEGDSLADVEQNDTVTEEQPAAEETATESENSGDTAESEENTQFTTELIVRYIQDNLEEISVIITLILTVFYQVRKHSVLNKSIRTLNNNSITAVESSREAMEGTASAVTGYKTEIEALLTEFRTNVEEKQKLEQTLAEVEKFLKASKLANVELSNEVAELLVLANIPNSKKEELYSRHLAAVGAIAEAEKMEVNTDGNGHEAE